MVGNQENILVEFDYDNISIIDPNKIIDENGKVKERVVKQEDLVMYANLECQLLPRTKLALGAANNDAIKTVSIATINFLKPGDKQFLDNSWTDEITGKGALEGKGVNQVKLNTVKNPNDPNDIFFTQQTYTNGVPGTIDNGLLGITSINVRQNTSFTPTVTMKLTDVKGRALFEGADNSPYAAFFNLPYPIFYLTLKGYYGKAVRLTLMLQSFTSSYNYNTSNFEITLTFFSYKYSLLAEVSMGALLAVPNMYKSDLTIETKENTDSQYTAIKNTKVSLGYEKIKEVYSEYKTKGLIPEDFPEMTIVQLKNRVETFITKSLDEFTKINKGPINDIQEYENIINEYRNRVYTGIVESWFNDNLDKENFLVLKNDKTKIYTFKKGIENKESAINALKTLFTDFNGKLNKNPTVGENGSFQSGTNPPKKESTKIVCDIKIDDVRVELTDFKSDIDVLETFVARKKLKEPPNENSPEFIQFATTLEVTNQFQNTDYVGEDGNRNPVQYWFKFEDETPSSKDAEKKIDDFTQSILSTKGKKTFIDKLNEITKTLKINRDIIETSLANQLYEVLQTKDNGLGFAPNIRNILAVFFASGEAFIRLLDQTSETAWALNENNDARKYRAKAIFNSDIAGASPDNLTPGVDGLQPIYPWPQFIAKTSGQGGKEIFEIKYPGDVTYTNITKSNIPDVWPEVEFVEEFISGLIDKDNSNNTSNEGVISNPAQNIRRISFNAIEFPIDNTVFSNKEEVKFFYEIYERMLSISTVSKLTRATENSQEKDKILNVISDSELLNIINSVSSDNPFLIKKLTDYTYNSSNFLPTLKSISNDGLGQSWQNYIRAVYNTQYIKNKDVNYGFLLTNSNFLNLEKTKPEISTGENEKDFLEYIEKSTSSNKIDFTDLYPFTNKEWLSDYLANSSSISNAESAFNTTKVLTFDRSRKIICNYLEGENSLNRRPITNFNYIDYKFPTNNGVPITTYTLKDFYKTRTVDKQLTTEGDLLYNNYENQLIASQTTSILNTPYFINSIQEGVLNYRNFSKYPYISAAYYFINSLPLGTLKEKYKSYSNNATTDLDYIFATIKKFGAVHKVPYAWILKIGSVWHRYKTYVETGNDILTTSWTGFNYSQNFDPISGDTSKSYVFNLNGVTTEITLQSNEYIVNNTDVIQQTYFNVGFYPKLINDFNVFLQGFEIYQDYSNEDIQLGFKSGVTLNVANIATIDLQKGFDPAYNDRVLKIKPWSVSVDSFFDNTSIYPMPSHGSLLNQTLNECFDINTAPIYKLKREVLNNGSMYNGSVRFFWGLPNYGYFDDSQILKPKPYEYMKKVFASGNTKQENFSLRGNQEYSNIEELFSVFEKSVLDEFETAFLNFSKSVYDSEDMVKTDNGKKTDLFNNNQKDLVLKNFQGLMRNLMKVNKQTFLNGDDFVSKIQNNQVKNIINQLGEFLNYDVVFKYGNPSSFDRKLFTTFSSEQYQLQETPLFANPYVWEKYTVKTPDALPTKDNQITLAQSIASFQDEWKALQIYVGFSEVKNLKYSSTGSNITDFFVDFNIAFTVDNIKNLAPIIKIYATQKLNNEKLNATNFYNLMSDYLGKNERFLNEILNNFFIKLQTKLPRATINSQPRRISSVTGGEQTKSEIYQTFKALNDKWISGNDFKTKTLFEDVLLMDRASRNIGEKVLVDLEKLRSILVNPNTQTSMLTYIQSIIIDNHFIVMNLPSYINFYNTQDVVKNPIPRPEGVLEFGNTLFGTFTNVDYRDSSAKMVCFYAGKSSEQPEISNNADFRYRSDAFDLRRASDNPLREDIINKKDWSLSNKVVGFNVDIGPQNQQIFLGFDVSQTAGKATAESIQIITEMGNVNNSRGGASSQSISLYNLYKNRSYTCSLTMLGNAMVQPTMYFNLRHVPMFSGPYIILEVNHTISPGTFMTYIKGSRQANAQLSNVDDYVQSLKTAIVSSILRTIEQEKIAKTKETSTKVTTTSTTNPPSELEKKTSPETNTVLSLANKNGGNTSALVNDCKDSLDVKYRETFNIFKITEKNSITLSSLKNIIINNTSGFDSLNQEDKEKLNKVIFTKVYLDNYSSVLDKQIESYGNNFGNVNLKSYWGSSSTFEKEYFCSNNKVPMAVFSSPSQFVSLYSSRWKDRIRDLNIDDQESVFNFIIKNQDANINETSYTPTAIDKLRIRSAIREYNSINLNTFTSI